MIPLVAIDERVLVTLTLEQVVYAERIGRMRRELAVKRNRSHRNNLTMSDEAAMAMNVRSAVGECAVHQLFPWLEWHEYSEADDLSDLADIGDFIDVKTPHQEPDEAPRRLLAFTWHDDWVYVLCLPIGRNRFRIMGWVWGREFKDAPCVELQPGRPCRMVEPVIPPLHPIRELQELALTRQQRTLVHHCDVCGCVAFHGLGSPLPEPHGWFCDQHRPNR